MNRNNVGASIIGCDINSAHNKLGAGILGVRTRLTEFKLVLIKQTLNMGSISHLLHNKLNLLNN
jgi:hypothetical protein